MFDISIFVNVLILQACACERQADETVADALAVFGENSWVKSLPAAFFCPLRPFNICCYCARVGPKAKCFWPRPNVNCRYCAKRIKPCIPVVYPLSPCYLSVLTIFRSFASFERTPISSTEQISSAEPVAKRARGGRMRKLLPKSLISN